MKSNFLIVLACGLAAAGVLPAGEAAQPAAQINVTFVAPEKFADVKDDVMGSDRDRDHVLDQLKAHMISTARYYLPAGQTLEIRVTEVDLAGDFEAWRGSEFGHIRILREVYPPRMTLEFRLLDAEGKVLQEGERRLQNAGYLMTLGMPPSDALRHEKEMIRDWMRHEFKRAS